MHRSFATLLLLLIIAAASPGQVIAQRGSPPLPDIAASMGDCLARRVGVPSRVYDVRDGYIVLLMLPGDPSANQDVQTPWPPVDTIAFVEVAIEPNDPGDTPGRHVATIWRGDTPAYVVARNGGWFTFGIGGETRYCLSGALGRL